MSVQEEENFMQKVLAGQARQKICRLRESVGWSYRELATRSGLSPETLKALEEGQKPITPCHLRKILDAYKYFQEQPL